MKWRGEGLRGVGELRGWLKRNERSSALKRSERFLWALRLEDRAEHAVCLCSCGARGGRRTRAYKSGWPSYKPHTNSQKQPNNETTEGRNIKVPDQAPLFVKLNVGKVTQQTDPVEAAAAPKWLKVRLTTFLLQAQAQQL